MTSVALVDSLEPSFNGFMGDPEAKARFRGCSWRDWFALFTRVACRICMILFVGVREGARRSVSPVFGSMFSPEARPAPALGAVREQANESAADLRLSFRAWRAACHGAKTESHSSRSPRPGCDG